MPGGEDAAAGVICHQALAGVLLAMASADPEVAGAASSAESWKDSSAPERIRTWAAP